APGLVRCGRAPVSGGSLGGSAARGKSGRGAALRDARARGARIESARRPRDLDLRSSGLTTTISVPVRSVDSMLLIVPPGPRTATGVTADTVVAGLPLLRRIVLAGARAGFSRVLVQSGQAEAERLLGGTAASVLSGVQQPDSRRRIVILPANVVPQT